MAKEKSVYIDARMIDQSGIGMYLRSILPYVVEHFSVTLMGDPRRLGEFPWSGRATIVPLNSPIYSIREQARLPLSVPQCDVFWSPHFNIPYFPIRAKKRLVTIHDVYHLAFAHELPLLQRLYARMIFRRIAAIADGVITVSRFSANEIHNHLDLGADKVRVIYNGVDSSRFHPVENASLLIETREKFHLPERFILFVGNVKPHKNLSRLLQACKAVRERFPDLHLVVVGTVEGLRTVDREFVREMSRLEANPFLRFLQNVPDETLPMLYNLADFCAVPSLYEGFGLPVLEAMACGCPVAASRIGSIREVAGDAVAYFDPRDVRDMAATLQRLWENPEAQETYRRWGLQRAERFTWEKSARQHIEVLEQL
ncbi:MAG: glycosyltransferase family 1 protein [Calditrichaeota bacterium]|nr:MAG: glycosyltransferase family 1 protein [Calditrichota bacterium]